jgi:hypothetical protein
LGPGSAPMVAPTPMAGYAHAVAGQQHQHHQPPRASPPAGFPSSAASPVRVPNHIALQTKPSLATLNRTTELVAPRTSMIQPESATLPSAAPPPPPPPPLPTGHLAGDPRSGVDGEHQTGQVAGQNGTALRNGQNGQNQTDALEYGNPDLASVPVSSASPTSTPSSASAVVTSPLPAAQILSHSLSVRSNESRAYDGNKATNRQTIYRPYSGMLRSSTSTSAPGRRASADSVRTLRSFVDDRDAAPHSAPRRGAGPDLPLSRHKPHAAGAPSIPADAAAHGNHRGGPSGTTPAAGTSGSALGSAGLGLAQHRDALLAPLAAVIPAASSVLREEPAALVALRRAMDAVADDFSFINRTVLMWDQGAKQAREAREAERQARAAETERRLEALFDDRDIGYVDVAQVEGDLRREEAMRRASWRRCSTRSGRASTTRWTG